MIDDVFKPKAKEQKFLKNNSFKQENTFSKEKYSEEELKTKSEDFAEINNIIDAIRENAEEANKPLNKAIFKRLSEKNHKDFSSLLKETQQLKNNLYKKVSESKKGFVLDLSKNSELKEHANNIFGNNKTSISFEDYMTLLELKRTLEIDEIIEVSELEKI